MRAEITLRESYPSVNLGHRSRSEPRNHALSPQNTIRHIVIESGAAGQYDLPMQIDTLLGYTLTFLLLGTHDDHTLVERC